MVRSVAWKVAAALALFAGGLATGRYVLMKDIPQTASSPAPAASPRGIDSSRENAIPVKRAEPLVAVREMWL
jgi:hypothetical protein